MGLKSSFTIIAIFLFMNAFSDDCFTSDGYCTGDDCCPSDDCCPYDKQEWCNKEYESCHTCTEQDKDDLKLEQKQFDIFITEVENYNKIKLVINTIKCFENGTIVPIMDRITEDKHNTMNNLYERVYENISICNNCDLYSTPSDYYNQCMKPVRDYMINSIKGIRLAVRKRIVDVIDTYKQECDNILTK